MTQEAEDSHDERHCANHPAFPALAICSLCGRDMCAHCHTVSLTGYAVCRGCPVAEAAMPRTTWESRRGLGRIHGFADTAAAILINPRTFFGVIGPNREWVLPTIFGFICLLLGTGMALAWQILLGDNFAEILDPVVAEVGLPRNSTILLLFASLPISAALIHGIHVVLLFASLQMAGAADVKWPAVARLVGYASAAQLFLIVPPILEFPIGHFLAVLWLFNLEVTGVRTYFGLSVGRSIFVVLLPFLFMMLFGA